MSRRRRKRKARGPGVYENPDGSVTTVTHTNGMIVETKVRPAPRPGEAKKTVTRIPIAGPPAGEPISGLIQAPVIRTNVIPGEPASVTVDQATGLEFSSRSEMDAYYKAHNLVDMSGKEGAKRMAAPSFAEKPKSEGSQYVQSFDPNGMPPPGKISEKTIMTPAARQRLFGGAPLKIGRRFR